MITRVDGVGFSGIKPVNKKVIRNLVNANKQAPKGISKTPIRLEKDFFDKNPLLTGVGVGSYYSAIATMGTCALGWFAGKYS